MFVREALRRRRNAKRRAKDVAVAALLGSEKGRSLYWRNLAEECARSSMIELLEKAVSLEGDLIECGVFRGGSIRMICKTVRDLVGRKKTVFGLDSFEGFPETSFSSADTKLFRPVSRLKGKFQDASDVPGLLTDFAEAFDIVLNLRKGFFEDTLPELVDRRYCFIHLDCDTYNSHRECLHALFDRLVPGGVIVYDDYCSKAWPGATEAIDQFLADKPQTVELLCSRERPAWYTIK